MRILAFDTATPATTVALCDQLELASEARDDPPPGARPRHASRLLALIVELLNRASVSWAELDRIAVGVGPGTFTGLRIGLATAKALASTRGIPLVGVSTLHSLALNGADCDEFGKVEAVVAIVDARRSELFAAAWPAADGGHKARIGSAPPLLTPGVFTAQQLAQWLAPQPIRLLAIGDGAIQSRVVLERSGAVIPEDTSELHRVTAMNHCRLAADLSAGPPDQIRPEYLRLPDAEIARRKAVSR